MTRMTGSALLQDPIAFDAADARALPGLSGATVVLMTRDHRRWFVRKAARDPDGNARLRRQLAKQLAFATAQGGAVRAPEVYAEGEIDGRFYFDMQFVRGTDGISYLRRANYAEVVAVADRLCGYLGEIAARPAREPVAGTLVEALATKVLEVQRKTGAIHAESFALVLSALDRLRAQPPALAPTLCHGDLTLENLVIEEGGVFWLIDFLDAPFEHWWQDLAKLHQDLEGGWYLRSQAPIARCVLDYVSRRLITAATVLEPVYGQLHALMLACTFARILPYTRSPEERAFVQLRIDHFARNLTTKPRSP